MLKNYFEINENEVITTFLKEFRQKKNIQYIILDSSPKSFVDVRVLSLRNHGMGEKIKNLKKPLSKCEKNENIECFKQLISSGDRVILDSLGNTYDYLMALEYILNENLSFINQEIQTAGHKEVFALNLDDKISVAKNIFLKNKINILPVIDKEQRIMGELRPIDLLVNNLNTGNSEKGNLYSENLKENILSLPIENIINKKPYTIEKNKTYTDVLKIMIEKKLPSLIVLDNEKLYSVVSYKDIFKLVNINLENKEFTVELVNKTDMFEDDFDLIGDLIEKTMKKIVRISDYDSIKVSFKNHGNTIGGHKRKIEVNIVLSKGNKIIHIDKQITPGTSFDENKNDRNKEVWNIPITVQEALKTLENKVKEEKLKEK